MDAAIAFFVGIFIGSTAGIFTFALLAAAKMEAPDRANTGGCTGEDIGQME